MPSNRVLRINNPCSQSWDEMTASGHGRFCLSCEKVVVDFTQMSDLEISRILSKSKSKTCGRIYGSQLNRPLQEPPQPESLSEKFGKIAAMIALLTGLQSRAQDQDTLTTDTIQIENVVVSDTSVMIDLDSTSVEFISDTVVVDSADTGNTMDKGLVLQIPDVKFQLVPNEVLFVSGCIVMGEMSYEEPAIHPNLIDTMIHKKDSLEAAKDREGIAIKKSEVPSDNKQNREQEKQPDPLTMIIPSNSASIITDDKKPKKS